MGKRITFSSPNGRQVKRACTVIPRLSSASTRGLGRVPRMYFADAEDSTLVIHLYSEGSLRKVLVADGWRY